MLNRAERKTLKIMAVGALVGFIGYTWWAWYRAETRAGNPTIDQDSAWENRVRIPEVIVYER